MNNVGEYLKKEREKQGITIDEAAKVTRIRKAYLQAIEDGNFDMQSPVFIKGFLKSYSQFLGLDADVVLERYSGGTAIEKEVKPAVAEEEKKQKPAPSYNKYVLPAIVALSLVTLIIMISIVNRKTEMAPKSAPLKEAKVAPREPMANATSHVLPVPVKEKPFHPLTTLVAPKTKPPVAVSIPPIKPAQAPEKPLKKYTLVVTARELTWLRVTVDSSNPVEVLMKNGEVTTWFADNKITLVAGNAGGIELNLNGKPLERLGPSGKVVTKVFSE